MATHKKMRRYEMNRDGSLQQVSWSIQRPTGKHAKMPWSPTPEWSTTSASLEVLHHHTSPKCNDPKKQSIVRQVLHFKPDKVSCDDVASHLLSPNCQRLFDLSMLRWQIIRSTGIWSLACVWSKHNTSIVKCSGKPLHCLSWSWALRGHITKTGHPSHKQKGGRASRY